MAHSETDGPNRIVRQLNRLTEDPVGRLVARTEEVFQSPTWIYECLDPGCREEFESPHAHMGKVQCPACGANRIRATGKREPGAA